jgi:N-dimethylarginine dimethylaminohydrolase
MFEVGVFNEWDPLEEILVGRIEGGRIPRGDPGLRALEFPELSSSADIPSGPFPDRVVEETAEDLDTLATALTQLGVVVHRPEPLDHSRVFSTPDWQSDGFFNYCPRDSVLIVGQTMIETPMVLRARQYENLAYRTLLKSCFQRGAQWISAPRPRLLDRQYGKANGLSIALDESEPLFDAANVARCGRDLFYLVSDSGNHLGAEWLARTIGSNYRVHVCDQLRNTIHIDTTLVLVRPGLLFAPAPFVSAKSLPPALRKWEVVYVDDVVESPAGGPMLSSKWVGLNFLMLSPTLAIVDKRQTGVLRALERRGVETLRLELRHAQRLGGGFHCVTLDIRRKGTLEAYCD